MIAFNSQKKVRCDPCLAADTEFPQWYINQLKYPAKYKELQLRDSSTKQAESEKFSC
jgi:hypothetical protein